MDKYIKICTRCKNTCKQRADMGIKMIKCPSYEPKIQPLANRKAGSFNPKVEEPVDLLN